MALIGCYIPEHRCPLHGTTPGTHIHDTALTGLRTIDAHLTG